MRRKAASKIEAIFISSEITGYQDEYAGAAGTQRGDFKRSITKPLILGQDNPGARAYFAEPDLVIFVALEVIVMNLDRYACR
jgi:hypothetical protein